MQSTMPINQMIDALHELDHDPSKYLQLWLALLSSIGGSAHARHGRDGQLHVIFGLPCDAQMRHRSRWGHFLWEDLKRVDGRYDALVQLVMVPRHHLQVAV